jgi:ABC-type antimicrobial peptide transport system ATPase subunit
MSLFVSKQWVVFYGPNKNTALPVAVSKKFAEFATHCGTATSINAIPDFANSFCSLTKIGFNSSDGNDESAFLMISLGQM